MERNTTVDFDKDNYLEVFRSKSVRRKITDPAQLGRLFDLVVEFLRQKQNCNLKASYDCEGTGYNSGMGLMIPHTTYHVRLTKLDKQNIKDLIAFGGMVLGTSSGEPISIAISTIIGLFDKVSKLKKQYGEMCIINSLDSLKRKTTSNIYRIFSGSTCKYQKIECQFLCPNNDQCGISEEDVETTIKALVDKGILKRVNNVDPAEWGMVF